MVHTLKLYPTHKIFKVLLGIKCLQLNSMQIEAITGAKENGYKIPSQLPA
jgi:hypothetical protein